MILFVEREGVKGFERGVRLGKCLAARREGPTCMQKRAGGASSAVSSPRWREGLFRLIF